MQHTDEQIEEMLAARRRQRAELGLLISSGVALGRTGSQEIFDDFLRRSVKGLE